MREGKEILKTIPGVRNIRAGRTIQTDRQYRYCWLVSLASQAALNTYLEHPAYLRYANNVFRPPPIGSCWISRNIEG